MVVRRTKATDMTAAHIAPSGELRRSSPKIAEHLRKIRNLVVKLETGLAPYFGGRSPTAVHDKVTQALTDAQRGQETKREGLTPEATDLYEAKGELLEIIEDLNRIGRVVFRGRAEIAAKFNKDILLRARRRAKKAKDAGEVGGQFASVMLGDDTGGAVEIAGAAVVAEALPQFHQAIVRHGGKRLKARTVKSPNRFRRVLPAVKRQAKHRTHACA